MKKNYSSKLTMAIFTMLIFITNAAFAQLYINEFMASNDAAYPGPQGDYPDWIEIYNAGSEDVMLGGYYLYDAIDLADVIVGLQVASNTNPSSAPDTDADVDGDGNIGVAEVIYAMQVVAGVR